MILTILLLPVFAGIITFLLKNARIRRGLLVLTATGHTILTCQMVLHRPDPAMGGWLLLDSIGVIFLSITSVLFLAVSVYAVGFLANEGTDTRIDFEEEGLFFNQPEKVFIGGLLFFLSSMTLVTLSQHVGLLWLAIETTTLMSAPLIYFHRHHRSLEATWKYLMVCSVGLGLALLGNLLFMMASADIDHSDASMILGQIVIQAANWHPLWLQAAFIFILIGYGTKMGLAPMHTWLPDAHSESPSLVSALMSGALLNCAFLGILRFQQILVAAGLGNFANNLLLIFGLFSMAVASIFVIGQPNFKRLLAFSSVEHMGILSMGVGIGGSAVYGAMLHSVNHSLIKATLFMVAGNFIQIFKSKQATDVKGALYISPMNALFWIIGILALTGSPPFGLFISEFIILFGAIEQDFYWVAAVYLGILGIIFTAMTAIIIPMVQGKPSFEGPYSKESWTSLMPPAALGMVVLLLGIYVPPFLAERLQDAAWVLGGG